MVLVHRHRTERKRRFEPSFSWQEG
jgi:hypothetical protein